MKNFTFLMLLLGLLFNQATAQISIGGKPYSYHNALPKNGAKTTMPSLPTAKIQAEDALDEEYGNAPRFGYPFPVDYSLT
ncbi:MAG: hypothetical protein AB8G22_20680, partial [Saprospiraceae bacterium]